MLSSSWLRQIQIRTYMNNTAVYKYLNKFTLQIPLPSLTWAALDYDAVAGAFRAVALRAAVAAIRATVAAIRAAVAALRAATAASLTFVVGMVRDQQEEVGVGGERTVIGDGVY